MSPPRRKPGSRFLSLHEFISPSLALQCTSAYLPHMIVRRLVSGLMTLMAVQFAILGAQPLCAGDHHSASTASADAMAGMSHDGMMDHGSTDPCSPTAPDSHSTHSPLTCLAMTGCAPTSLASLGALDVVAPPMTVHSAGREPATLRSVISAPETPPPIA